MTRAVVALGTTRRPKVLAVERALSDLRQRFPDFLPGELHVEPRSVTSGVPSTPRTVEEMRRGARNRAVNARDGLVAEGLTPSLSLGLEGGVASEDGEVFLESWAHAITPERESSGSSGRIPLPTELARAVMVDREELGPAADRQFARRDVAGGEGTFGVLTRGVVVREDAFVRAILHALAPIYNADAY